MILPLLGLIVGILIGLATTVRLPITYSDYMAIGILAALDSVFGGMRAGYEGTFDTVVFISGFFINTLLAMLLTMLGDRLGVDLVLGATVAFSIRIFMNVGIIRRHLLRHVVLKKEGKMDSR